MLHLSLDNGGTNTPTALNLTRTVVFDPKNGARPSARKVVVLLTDGESYDFNLTVQEAEKLRVRNYPCMRIFQASEYRCISRI